MSPKSDVAVVDPGRPVESAPSFGDIEDDATLALRRAQVFRGLTESERARIAAASEVVRIPQDRVIARAGEGGEPRAFYFVLKGQVAFAEFEKGKVPRGPVNPKKRVTPVMQLSRRNVALFDVDDFFANDHVAEVRNDAGTKSEMALYTCVPVVLVKVPGAALDEGLRDLPALKDAIDARAEASYYRQTFLKLENRADIFDLYVKEGLEYAQAIKIIQSDKCIDCDECVKACEDRHGIARIERFGPKIGLIQLTLNCRTCVDARCIDPCNFDAIAFDEKIKEVVVYDNCVGCTLCAKACPHEAIRMVDVQERPEPDVDIVQIARKAAGEKPGTVVAQGEEAGAAAKKAKKKPKRIANKCDHCLGYSDLACISACPTGAIIQIDPRALFRRDGGLIERADRYFDTAPFEQGWSETTRTQGAGFMKALFVVAGLAVLGCIWEFLARHHARDLSLYRGLVSAISGPEAGRTLLLTFTPVSGFGRWLGYVGAGMMTVAALYTLRLHVPGLRRLGSSKTWFDFHVVFGTAGPALSLLHTDLHVFQLYWVSALWWAIFLVVITGVVGRYLYTLVPRAEVAVARDRDRLDEGIKQVADQWASMTVSANVLNQFLKVQEKTAQAAPEATMGPLALLGYIATSEVRRIRGAIALRTGLLANMKNERLRKTTIKLMSRRASIERRARLLGAAKPLLAQWRSFHIAISIVMFLLLIAHAAISIWATGL